MKSKFLSLAIIALIAVSTVSCSSSSNQTPTTNNPVAGNGFSWRENDPASTTIQTAASTSFSTQFKTLIAKNAAGNTIFEINLTGTAPATYLFGSGTGNALAFTIPNPMFNATSGECVVTANTNNKISGTFKAFISGTGITRLYGTFTDIAVNP
jgi:hypothetical protein